jgi:hypothetical protein
MKKPETNLHRVKRYFREMTAKHGYMVIGKTRWAPPLRVGSVLSEMGGIFVDFEVVITEKTTRREWVRQWMELNNSPVDKIPRGTVFWKVVRYRKPRRKA